MSEELYETDETQTLEMDEILEKVINYCAHEAQEKLVQVGSFEPFTVVVDGENMTIESHPGDEEEAIRKSARSAVASASSFATYYCYCYDGYVDTDQGEMDAIVIEAAQRDQEKAYVIVSIYSQSEEGEGSITFEEGLAYIGDAEMWFDRKAVEVGEEEERRAAQAETTQADNQAKAQEMLERLRAEKAAEEAAAAEAAAEQDAE